MWGRDICPGDCGSGQSVKHLQGADQHALVQPADGVHGKVRRGAVGIERGLIAVLLVDDDGVGIRLDAVGNVADAARFGARGGGELAKDRGNLFAVFRAEGHADGEGDHGYSKHQWRKAKTSMTSNITKKMLRRLHRLYACGSSRSRISYCFPTLRNIL